jgi:hypothetical protein
VPSRLHFTLLSLRVGACALCLAAVLALPLAAAPVALGASLGGGNALSELTEGSAETETTPTTTTATTTSSEPRNSHTVIAIVLGVAVVLLAGVAFAIARDARRVAPATDGELIEGSTARHSEAALRKRRAKAKAARRQRKRNR